MYNQANTIGVPNRQTSVPMRQIGVIDATNCEPYSYDDDSLRSILRKRIQQTVIDLICIIIAFVSFICVYFLVDPKIRGFYCNETDIFYPYHDNTVEFWVVGIYGTLAPILFIIGVELLNSKIIQMRGERDGSLRRRYFVITLIHGLSLFVLGIGICLLLTEIGKRWVGRLRPHFIAECNPDMSTINCTVTYSGLTPTYSYLQYISTGGNFCRNDAKTVKEARLSFPSGHASYSWYTMIFLVVYLEARLHFLRFRFIKPMIQMSCVIAAWVTSLSRISDYHHRGTDVLGGGILGIIVALFITLLVGRVLWVYNRKQRYHDFDLKPYKVQM